MKTFTIHLDDELTVGTDHLSILPFVEVEDYVYNDKMKTGLRLGNFYRISDQGTEISTPYHFSIEKIFDHPDGHPFKNYIDYANVFFLNDKFLVGKETDKFQVESPDTALIYIPSFDSSFNLTLNNYHALSEKGSVIYGRTRSDENDADLTRSYVLFLADGEITKFNFQYNGERHTYEITYSDTAVKVLSHEISEIVETPNATVVSTPAGPSAKSFSDYRKQKASETKEYKAVKDLSPLQKYMR